MVTSRKSIGYVRASARVPAGPQHDALGKHGIADRYEEGREAENIDACVKGLRRGFELWVTTLDRLAAKRHLLRATVAAIHAKGAVIVEASTGRRSDGREQWTEMLLDAVARMAGDLRPLTSEQAKAMAAKSARARRLLATEKRMGEAEARRIWTTNGNWSNGQCLSHMTGWSLAEAYRKLGTRKLAKGRPRKEAE